MGHNKKQTKLYLKILNYKYLKVIPNWNMGYKTIGQQPNHIKKNIMNTFYFLKFHLKLEDIFFKFLKIPT